MPEDFSNALAGVSSGSEDDAISSSLNRRPRGRGSDGEDDDASDSDGGQQARQVMRQPPVDANAQELRQALGFAQLMFSETRAKLLELTKRHNALVSEVESQRTTGRGCKSKTPVSPLNQSIAEVARKYCLFYHLWVPGLLFPIHGPPKVDPRDPSRWQSPESRTIAEQAELYHILPAELHKSLRTYPDFPRVFTKAITEERANIVKNIKDIAADLFADLDIKSTIFSGAKSLKAQEPKLLELLKLPGDLEYTQLSPILFTDPTQLRGNELFKNPILVQIARVLMFGKATISSNKKRGGPKARGERMGAQTVTEGLIACTATLARYLLSHDSEFSAKGNATGIQYQKDFEFYLKLLLQPENRRWALEVVNYFNIGVFDLKPSLAATQSNDDSGAPNQVRSREDKLLLEIGDNADEPAFPSRPPSPSFSDHDPEVWPYSATTGNYLPATVPQVVASQFPLPTIADSHDASRPVDTVRPRPTLRKPAGLPDPPSISYANDRQPTQPRLIHTTYETSLFRGPVNNATAVSNTINANDLHLDRLTINPAPEVVGHSESSASRSGRSMKGTVSSGSNKAKGVAMAAYPVGPAQVDHIHEFGTVAPAPQAQPPAGKMTRSRAKRH